MHTVRMCRQFNFVNKNFVIVSVNSLNMRMQATHMTFGFVLLLFFPYFCSFNLIFVVVLCRILCVTFVIISSLTVFALAKNVCGNIQLVECVLL